MTALETRTRRGTGVLSRTTPRTWWIVAAVGGLAVALAMPSIADSYWLFLIMFALVSVVIMQSLGIVVGRLGALALCQMTFVGIGAWVTQFAGLNDVPGGFLVWLLLGTLAAVPGGLIVGLTALRLRGPMLAVATFSLATTSTLIWTSGSFPGEQTGYILERPEWLASDTAYYYFLLVAVVIVAVVLLLIDRSRMGRSWIEIRFSERAAAAHGTRVALAKLSAFAISAAIAGLAGGLLVGLQGATYANSFTASLSLAVFAIAIMLGVKNTEAAILGGIFYVIFPVLIQLIGIPQDFAAVVFAVLAFFVLKAGGGIYGQHDIFRVQSRAKRARREDAAAAAAGPVERPAWPYPPAAPETTGKPALQVDSLTVRYGAVTAIDALSFTVEPGRIVGLIGPNGAGKSSVINAVTGFVPISEGTIRVQGLDVRGASPRQRSAKLGVKRSFQNLQVAPGLTVEGFIRLAAGRPLTREEVQATADWFFCPPIDRYVDVIDLTTRRRLEVAGLAVSRAPIILLDEPAAGHSAQESLELAAAIALIPERSGSAVLIVEHDIEMVRGLCSELIVMDTGALLAHGAPDEVLARPDVIEAYLGEPVGPAETETDAPSTR